jgi:hypothetical protein
MLLLCSIDTRAACDPFAAGAKPDDAFGRVVGTPSACSTTFST